MVQDSQGDGGSSGRRGRSNYAGKKEASLIGFRAEERKGKSQERKRKMLFQKKERPPHCPTTKRPILGEYQGEVPEKELKE